MIKRLQNTDIKLLRIFETIAECNGFTPAQTKLNMSQSSISTHMNQLETRLGVRLCERGHGIFRLTKDGEAALEASRKLFGALDDFCNDLAHSQNRIIGELHIGLIDNMVTHPNPKIRNALKSFNDHYPDASPDIHIGSAVDLEERILDGRLHLAIGPYPHGLSNLSYAPLFEEEEMLYCGKGHSLFDKEDGDLTLDDLADYKYASWGDVEFIQDNDRLINFNEYAASSNYEGIAYLILSGHYIGFVATHYAKYWAEQGLMRPILPELTRKQVTYHLLVHKTQPFPEMAAIFIEKLGCSELLSNTSFKP